MHPAEEALPPVCILAGGRATRLGELVRDRPKALMSVAGEPFVFHQLRLLAAHGATDVVLCVGYLGEQIVAAVGPERFGVRVQYSQDSPGLDGTLGAIRRALSLLGERFLVLYGDTYLPIDYRAANRRWRASDLPGLMTVLLNDGRWDRSNALLHEGLVIAYDKYSPRPAMRWIDYGLGGLTAHAIERFERGQSDLAALYASLAAERLLCGFEATERFHEIGTPAALVETAAYLAQLSERR
jgi:NDP-sugar pyrophosphorylase family protein